MKSEELIASIENGKTTTVLGWVVYILFVVGLICGMFWCPFLAVKNYGATSCFIYAGLSIVSWLWGCYINLRGDYTIKPIKPFGLKIPFDRWDDDEPA